VPSGAALTVLAVAGALGAAVCYGTASVLQAVAARRTSTEPGLSPRLLAQLARDRVYVAGLALDGLGFLAVLLSLRTLPLFLVEAAIAASVGVTAVIAGRYLAARLSTRDRWALSVLAVGLLLLAVSARPDAARALSAAAAWTVLAGAVLIAVVAWASAHRQLPTAVLAAGAGLAFGGLGVAARAVQWPSPAWRLVLDPLSYAVLGYGLLGTLLFAAALQHGSVTISSAITFAVETVVPAAVGIALLGDRARDGFWPVAVLGFVLTVGASIALARFGGAAEPPVPG
jgi:hypothetical protein